MVYGKNGNPKNDRDNDGIPNQIADYEQAVYKTTGYHCDIINYNPDTHPLKDPDYSNRLLINHPNIQILNNVIYGSDSAGVNDGSTLFTVYFPPYWDPCKKYPVKLNGFGGGADNNSQYIGREINNAVLAGLSVDYGDGLLVVQSNTGGKESSGKNSDAMDDVGSFLTKVMRRFGADMDRIITVGASRAGGNVITWGANPDGHDYNVSAIYSYVVDLKSTPGTTLNTFQSWVGVLKKALGSPFAYRYGEFMDLDEDPSRSLTIEEIIALITKTRLGVETEEEALAKSPYGIFSRNDLTESLRKKRILISYGMHDSFMPVPGLLEFDYLLKEKEIPARVILGYAIGHGFYDTAGDANKTLLKLVQGKEIKPFEGNSRVFYMPNKLVNDGNGTDRKKYKYIEINDDLIERIRLTRGYEDYFDDDHDASKLAFSVTVPYAAGRGLPASIVLMGEKGKEWEIMLRKEEGYHPVYRRRGVFGESGVFNGKDINRQEGEQACFGDEYVVLSYATDLEPATYEWFFMYDGKEIPNRFTPFVSPASAQEVSRPAKAITIVMDDQPLQQEYNHPDKKRRDCVNMGVDQYHPLLLEENNNPAFNPIEDVYLSVGESINLDFNAVDPDGDEVVYDVINAVTGRLLKNIEFNGKTGELNYTALEEDIGEYVIKAFAKDGKGGVGEYIFKAEIKATE